VTDTKKKTVPGTRAAIEKILANVEETMTKGPAKATLADYIRLLQLKKEMDQEMTETTTMTWVDPPTQEK
jgi:hypothetical protein